MIYRCDLVPQYLRYKKEVDRAISEVLKSGKYILGEEVKQFESEFAAYLGIKNAIGVANGTDALILAIKALEITKGDEIITTPFTAVPTVSAIIAAGATPVFADIDPATYLIDLNKIAEVVSSKTRAVIPVHIFGNVVDIPKLNKILGNKIPVIEDACQAHGSKIRGKLTGTMGQINAFSFYPTKNVGAYGDGGAVTTKSAQLKRKIELLRMYGMKDKDHIVINGVNSRLDELQAAILRIKLKHLDETNKKRNRIALLYRKNLKESLFEFQHIDDDIYCNYHVFVAKFNGNRKRFVDYLETKGIQTNVYYPIPLHLQKANRFLNINKGSLPQAEGLCKKVIALPLYPEMPDNILEYVIKTINKYK